MKLKKFFAGVLAAAMMLTVGATAVLAEGTISVKKDGNENEAKMFTAEDHLLTLTKTLVVTNGTAPDHMEFSFTVDGVAGAATKAEFNATEEKLFTTGNNYTANFNIDLEKVLGDNKTKVGAYEYTISEDAFSYPGVVKNDSDLTMKITVVNKTGEIGGGYGYYVALYRGGNKIEAKDAFKNTYDSKSMTLSKTVHGSLGDLAKEFTFIVKFMPDSDAVANLYKGPQVGDLGADVAIAGKKANDYLELNTPYTVTLKHGKSIVFNNLPANIKYEVYEDGSTVLENKIKNGDYTVELKNGEEVIAFNKDNFKYAGAVNTENVTAAFHNTHEGVPDTGVILDNAPYIAMLAIVAIGGVALMLNKRRRDEE